MSHAQASRWSSLGSARRLSMTAVAKRGKLMKTRRRQRKIEKIVPPTGDPSPLKHSNQSASCRDPCGSIGRCKFATRATWNGVHAASLAIQRAFCRRSGTTGGGATGVGITGVPRAQSRTRTVGSCLWSCRRCRYLRVHFFFTGAADEGLPRKLFTFFLFLYLFLYLKDLST